MSFSSNVVDAGYKKKAMDLEKGFSDSVTFEPSMPAAPVVPQWVPDFRAPLPAAPVAP